MFFFSRFESLFDSKNVTFVFIFLWKMCACVLMTNFILYLKRIQRIEKKRLFLLRLEEIQRFSMIIDLSSRPMKNGSKINSTVNTGVDEAEVWRIKIMICRKRQSDYKRRIRKQFFAASRFILITSSSVPTNRMHAGYRTKIRRQWNGWKNLMMFNLIKYQNQFRDASLLKQFSSR